MLAKRIALVVSVMIITLGCYFFMNRNYDPLARYSYDDPVARQALLNRLDERQIKYIIDYQIAPDEYMPYINSPKFNAYHIDLYNKASSYLYFLDPYKIVIVAEGITANGLDFDLCMESYMYLSYEEILRNLKIKE